LHLHVVAEGVESAAQADAARGAGCGELQGYLYSRPLPAKDVGVWLQRLDARYADEDMEISTQSVKLGE
jgi:EAL domain-containing protein (putative c-di-GMP-specific phosphodiesterase class I)